MGRLLVLLFVLIVSACGGGSEKEADSNTAINNPETNDSITTGANPLTSFNCSLSQTNLTVGATATLSCSSNLDDTSETIGISHSWSDGSIASLNGYEVTALNSGSSTLTLTAKHDGVNLSDSIAISVSEPFVVSGETLSCLPNNISLRPNQTFRPACYAYREDSSIVLASASDIESGAIAITFETEDKGVITVTPQGLVTAIKEGTETLQVTFMAQDENLNLSDSVTFTVSGNAISRSAFSATLNGSEPQSTRQINSFTDNAKLYLSETTIWLGEGSSKDVFISAEDEFQQLTDIDCDTQVFLTHTDTVSAELINAGDMVRYRFTGLQKGFTHGYFACTDGSLQTPPFTIQVKDPTTLTNLPESGLSTINGQPKIWLSPAGYPYVSSYSDSEDRLLLTAITGSPQTKSLEVQLSDENRAGHISTIGPDLANPNRPRLFSLYDDEGLGSLGEITFDELIRPFTRSLKPGWVADYKDSGLVGFEVVTSADNSNQWFSASNGGAVHLFSYNPTLERLQQSARIDSYLGTTLDADLALPPSGYACTGNRPLVAQCLGSEGLWIGQASVADSSRWNFRQITNNRCSSVEMSIDQANRVYLVWNRGDSESGEELILNQIQNGLVFSSTVANLQDGQVFTDIELDLDRNGIPRVLAIVENTGDQSRALYQYTYSIESGRERWQTDHVEYSSTIGPELDFAINRYGLSSIVLQPNSSELAYLVQPAFVDYSPSYFPFGEGSCDQLLPNTGELIVVELDYDQDGISDLLDEDDDDDGIPDIFDGDPLDSQLSGVDTDRDGIDNAIDLDDDNDGITDEIDVFPLDSNEWEDNDGDSIGNNTDTDDDNDGVPDTLDAFPFDASETLDTDGDGIGNNADIDDDNDRIADAQDSAPLNDQISGQDVDQDGIDDAIDDEIKHIFQINSSTSIGPINENSPEAHIYTATSTSQIMVTWSLARGDETGTTLNHPINGSPLLSIDPDSGEIQLLQPLDHETLSSFQFQLIAQSDFNGLNSETITLLIEDQDDSLPQITPQGEIPGFVVAWASYGQDGSDDGIFAQRYDSDGVPAGDEFQVNSYTDYNQTQPAISTLWDGGFIVTWASEGQDGSGYGVYAQRYNGLGQTLGQEFKVNTYTSSHQDSPSVSALIDGGYVITWQSHGQDGDLYGVYAQRFDKDSNPIGNEYRVNTYTDNNQSSPQVSALVDGGFVITWESYGQDGSGQGIYAQRYDANQLAIGSEFQVNTYTNNTQDSPAISSLVDGGFVITWSSSGQNGLYYDVYAQYYNHLGEASGQPFIVNTYTAGTQKSPSVSALIDGGVVMTWQSTPDGYDVYGQRYDATHIAIGNEFQINTYDNYRRDRYYPVISSLMDGGFIVTWVSEYQDGSIDGIFGQRYSAGGDAAGEEFQVNTYTTSNQNSSKVAGYGVLFGQVAEQIVAEQVIVNESVPDNYLVYQIQATDTADIDDPTDTSHQLRYSMSGEDADSFTLNSNTGELFLIESPDHETKPEYRFTVAATDLAGNQTTQSVVLMVVDQ